MADKWYPAIISMPYKVTEADTLIFLYVPHTSFIKIRRHGFVIKCLSVGILLLICCTTSAHIPEIYQM